jgi:hypothetical protein
MKYILDKLVSTNETRNSILNEKKLQYGFEKKDDIRTVEIDEEAIKQQFEKELLEEGFETMRVSISTRLNFNKASKNPKMLVEKFLLLKKTCEMVEFKVQEEKDMADSLRNKILVLQKDIVMRKQYL